MFSDDHKNSQLGKLTLLKIETIVDITVLKKVKFNWQLSHLIGPKAETEKHLGNADKLSFIPFYALRKCVSFPMIKSFVLYLFHQTYILPTDGFNFVISVFEVFHHLKV